MQTKTKILLGIGLIGLIGYVVYRNKKRTQKPNNSNNLNNPNKPKQTGLEDIFTINNNTDTPSSSTIKKEMADCKQKKGTWQPSSGGGFCQTWIKPQQTNTTIQPPPRINIGFPSVPSGGSNTLDTTNDVYNGDYLPTDDNEY
jgi:hypothetical protein